MVSNRNSFLRGTVIRAREELLTDDFCRRLGYVFALWLAEKMNVTPDAVAVAIGCDSRSSGPRLMRAFADGLTAAIGGLTAASGGLAAAVFFGFLAALFFRAKPKDYQK